MNSCARFGLLAAVSIGSLAMSDTAIAQERGKAANAGLEEIIVTARKQSESLLDVPVAVTAVTSQQLERAGVNDLGSLSRVAPQVIIAQGDSGAGASFSIRGLGSPHTDAGLEQSVTVNVDGVSFSRGNLVGLGLFDVEQLEVMKGPQALFFGKNSPAGVIAVRTRGGTDTLEGYVKAGYEFEAQEAYAEAAISGPLGDTLKGRIAVRGSTMKGWLKNVAEPLSAAQNPLYGVLGVGSPGAAHREGPGNKDLLGRVTLKWEPSADFDAELKVAGITHKDHGSTTQAYCYDDIGPMERGLVDPFADCKFDNKFTSVGINPALIKDWPIMRDDGEPFGRLKAITTSLNMNYQMGDNLTLTSVTGYLWMKYRQANDYSFTSYGGIPVALGEDFKSWSQELRLASDFDAPINFMLGAFYEDQKRTSYVNSYLFSVGPDAATGKFHTFESRHDLDGKTVSAFGQIRWNITDQLELAGGVRYTKEKRRQVTGNLFVHPVAGPLLGLIQAGPQSHLSFRDSHWSPEVTLSYKVTPDVMVYGAFKTGYKSGGFSAPSLYQYLPIGTNANPNIPAGTPPGFRIPDNGDYGFRPETSKGFEVGIKGKLFDNKVRFDLTAYHYKYSDLQVTAFNPSTFSFFVSNAASAKIQGVEFNTQWQVIPELVLNFSATYNDAKFGNFPSGNCWGGQPAGPGGVPVTAPTPGYCFTDPVTGETFNDLSGTRLPRAPKYTLNAGFDLNVPVGGNLMLGLNGDVAWRDDYITQEDHHPRAVQKGFALFNAGVRVYTEDEHYELALLGRNLGNKWYRELTSGKAFGKSTITGDLQGATPRGREIAVQGTFRF